MSLLVFKVERRTVRPWGVDGPSAYFKVVPEMMFVSGGVEHITADGPPGLQRLFLTHNHCILTHWFIRADSPVFEPRTVRDFAEKSVTASF